MTKRKLTRGKKLLAENKKHPEWELERKLIEHTRVNEARFSPNGKVLVSGSDDNMVRLWEVATGENINTLNGHSDSVYSVSFSPDVKTVASGSGDNMVRLWNAETGENIHTMEGHSDSVYSVSFSPDGKTVASGSRDDTVQLWDVATGENIHTMEGHSGTVLSVSFSPDGKMVASGSTDKSVCLWDVESGNKIKTITWRGFIVSVSFSPDGKTVACGSAGVVHLCDVETGENTKTLKGGGVTVRSVSFSPDGKTLVGGSDDNSVHLWDVETGEIINTLIPSDHKGQAKSVSFSPDGGRIAVATSKGNIQIWKLEAKAFLRNELLNTKGWDGKEEQDPRLMNSTELEERRKYHPDNMDAIMDGMDANTKHVFGLVERTPTSKEFTGNVKPLLKELYALYRKYEYDVDKLKIVHKRIKKCFKAIKKDKKLKTKRLKEIRIRSMTPKRETRKASRSMNSI